MKTGRITGAADRNGSRRVKCCDCEHNAKYRIFLTDLKMTIYACADHSQKYVW